MNNQTLFEIARECGRLRYHKDPESVIQITDKIIGSPERKQEAGFERILCTRGGALRQMGKSIEALKCAEESIKLNDKYSPPYVLAGACCFDLGLREEGGKYFNEAQSRGMPPKEIAKNKKSGKIRWERASQKNFKAPARYSYEDYGVDFEHELQKIELKRAEELTNEELDDYRGSIESSNEDGWFYKD